MNNGGEAAEMIVRLYLEGFEDTRYDAETGIQNQRQRTTVKDD